MVAVAFLVSSGLTMLRAILPAAAAADFLSSLASVFSAGSALSVAFFSSLASDFSAALASSVAGKGALLWPPGNGGLVWPVRGRVSFFGAGAAAGVGRISMERFLSLALASLDRRLAWARSARYLVRSSRHSL